MEDFVTLSVVRKTDQPSGAIAITIQLSSLRFSHWRAHRLGVRDLLMKRLDIVSFEEPIVVHRMPILLKLPRQCPRSDSVGGNPK
jgi:hypothetical protein